MLQDVGGVPRRSPPSVFSVILFVILRVESSRIRIRIIISLHLVPFSKNGTSMLYCISRFVLWDRFFFLNRISILAI